MARMHLNVFANHLDGDFLWREVLHIQQHGELPWVCWHLHTPRWSSRPLPCLFRCCSLTLAFRTGKSPFLLVAGEDRFTQNNCDHPSPCNHEDSLLTQSSEAAFPLQDLRSHKLRLPSYPHPVSTTLSVSSWTLTP